jgi:hypothetical protein
MKSEEQQDCQADEPRNYPSGSTGGCGPRDRGAMSQHHEHQHGGKSDGDEVSEEQQECAFGESRKTARDKNPTGGQRRHECRRNGHTDCQCT